MSLWGQTAYLAYAEMPDRSIENPTENLSRATMMCKQEFNFNSH